MNVRRQDRGRPPIPSTPRRQTIDPCNKVLNSDKGLLPPILPIRTRLFVFPRLVHWLRATIRIPVGLPIPAAVRVCVSRCTTVRPTRRRSTGSTRLSRAGGQIAKIFALLGRRCHYQ